MMGTHSALEAALNTARKAREGGGGLHVPKIHVKKPHAVKQHTGPIHSSVAGRTDHLPMEVPSGSYVLSADVVSHLGENNTAAGFVNLKRMFGGIPRGQGSQPYGHKGGPYGMADGGTAPAGVPIVAAGGEYVVHPYHVRQIGDGDLDLGHKVLDEWSKRIRADHVKLLKHLPPPKKN